MPRRKKKKVEPKVKVDATSKFVLKSEAQPGDLCYFVSCWSDVQWGEIIKVLDNEPEDCLFIQDQVEFKFFVVPCRLAAWEKETLKKMKWDISSKPESEFNYFKKIEDMSEEDLVKEKPKPKKAKAKKPKTKKDEPKVKAVKKRRTRTRKKRVS